MKFFRWFSFANPSFRNTCWILLGMMIYVSGGLFAGFPFVYSDSGAYISAGMEGRVAEFHPMTYGGFIFFSSLGKSLWFTALFQGLIISWLVFRVISEFTNSRRSQEISFFTVSILLAAATSINFNASTITPDVFAAVAILAVSLLIFGEKMGKAHRVLAFFFLFLGSTVHMSHVIMVFLILATLMCRWLYLRLRKRGVGRKLWIRMAVATGAWLVGLLFIPTFSVMWGGEFGLSPAAHVMPIAKLVDNGILRSYLVRNCNKPHMEGMKICEYRDSLSTSVSQFLWHPKSELFKIGGYIDSKEELSKLSGMIYSDPKWFLNILGETMRSVHEQLFLARVGDGLGPYKPDSSPGKAIYKCFRSDYNHFLNSKQNFEGGWRMRFSDQTDRQFRLLVFSLLLLGIYAYFWKALSLTKAQLALVGFLFWGIYMNAYASAGFHIALDRYHNRVVWILPLVALTILAVRHRELVGAIIRHFKPTSAPDHPTE